MDKDILVMGDFNLEDEEMFKALTGYGLKVPDALVGRDLGTNLERNKRYDQILHFPQYPSNFTNAGNVLDFYTGGIQPLFPDLKEKDKLAFTFQMSDHLPLWVQINTDIDDFVRCAPALAKRDGTSQSPSRPRARRNVPGLAALARPRPPCGRARPFGAPRPPAIMEWTPPSLSTASHGPR